MDVRAPDRGWKAFCDEGYDTLFYGNAILNRFTENNVEKWLRITAPSASSYVRYGIGGNYWGTEGLGDKAKKEAINKQILDFDDYQSMADLNGNKTLETLAGVQGIVSYDVAALELTGAAMVGAFSGLGSVNTSTAGQVSFNGACPESISGSQNILRLDFRVKADAAAGDYLLDVLIESAYNTGLAADFCISCDSALLTCTGAEDTVKCTLDLQALYDYLALRQLPDRFCDSADETRNELLTRYFLRLADVNGDGQVNILDYQRLYSLARSS